MTRSASAVASVERLLHTISARRALLSAGMGAAIGLDVAVLWELRHLIVTPLVTSHAGPVAAVLWALLRAALCGAAGAAVGYVIVRARRTRAIAAADMERLIPASRNLLFTALEATDEQEPAGLASAEAHATLRHRASQLATAVDVPVLLPWTSVSRAIAVSLVLWVMAVVATRAVPAGAPDRSVRNVIARASGTASISRVDVTVIPPAYTGRATQRLRNPSRIEALEGSTIVVTAAATGNSLIVATDSGEVHVPRPASGDFTWRATVQRDGFLALSPASSGNTADPRLIAIAMQVDAAPSARITAPARDMIVDSTRAPLAVTIEASDDIGLRTLELHITKVSGSGERFTFDEARIPLQVTRSALTAWRATGTLPLDTLLREPGDLVVYRARVADARPGVPPIESDAFIAERAAAGGIAAAGFALDPDEDRYAVSQQMVILKTERLIAAQKSLPRPAVEEQSRQLAAEQRRVRAEFVFMMGGEFEQAMIADENGIADLDESHEAESEGDLAAGRMVNRGRTALLTAIRAMSRAALTLGDQDLATALRHEKTALNNLQEAFSRQRFLMRALTQREALDFSRRLSGSLDSIARQTRPTPVGEVETQRVAVRDVLDQVRARGNSTTGPSYNSLALRVLQLDASNARAQRIAGWLQQAGGNSGAARTALDSATLGLSDWLTTLSRRQWPADEASLVRDIQQELGRSRNRSTPP
ncbi:MAG TPA: hypothetical protein VGE27_14720 [Gemmatimonas sp.]|uniref:hypothetical protein n=1 Tax=Gemmatimonas sp. TaxID=1962908 RepID=UPI002ED8B918